jgi:hypothetical protein
MYGPCINVNPGVDQPICDKDAANVRAFMRRAKGYHGWDMTHDLCWMTSAQLIDRYRLGDLSPLEVAHALLRLL